MSENILPIDPPPAMPDPALLVANPAPELVQNIEAPVTPRKKFPLFSVILLLILTVISVICVYLFLQVRELSVSQPVPSIPPVPLASVDPSLNLQTYTTDLFSFEYKSPLNVKEMTVMNINPEVSVSLEKNNSSIGILNIYKKNYKYKIDESVAHDLSVEEYLQWNILSNCSDLTLGMLVGKKCTTNPYSDNEYIFVSKSGGRFIELVGRPSFVTELDQILSTFKFIDSSMSYTCPASGYVDCMPSPDGPKPSCTKEAMDWYKTNCPGFQGGAL